MLLAQVDWTNVLVALIAGLPAIISAVLANHVRREIKTPSGTSIGKQVEDVNHTARSNWHTVNATARNLGIEMPPRARAERSQVDGLEDDEYQTPLADGTE